MKTLFWIKFIKIMFSIYLRTLFHAVKQKLIYRIKISYIYIQKVKKKKKLIIKM